MVINLIFLFCLLGLLFLLSKNIPNEIYKLCLAIIRQKKLSLLILAFLLLPGTIVHELSHFFCALVLRVGTGTLSVIPEIGNDGEIKTGHLMLDACDPFRLTIIGLAPIVFGTIIIYVFCLGFFPDIFASLLNMTLLKAIILYLLFAVSTTMFSSKKDLESLVIALPIVAIISLLIYFSGIRISLTEKLIDQVNTIVAATNNYLLFTAVIDYSLFFLLFLPGYIVSLINNRLRK